MAAVSLYCGSTAWRLCVSAAEQASSWRRFGGPPNAFTRRVARRRTGSLAAPMRLAIRPTQAQLRGACAAIDAFPPPPPSAEPRSSLSSAFIISPCWSTSAAGRKQGPGRCRGLLGAHDPDPILACLCLGGEPEPSPSRAASLREGNPNPSGLRSARNPYVHVLPKKGAAALPRYLAPLSSSASGMFLSFMKLINALFMRRMTSHSSSSSMRSVLPLSITSFAHESMRSQ